VRSLFSIQRRWHVVGVALGLCLAVALLFVSQVTAGAGGMGAEVRMKASPTGELSVSTGEPFLTAVDLRPGAGAGGRLVVGNQTGIALAVTVRPDRSSSDLDDQVHVRVAADGIVTAEGPLGALSDGWRPLVLPSGHRADLTFEVALLPGADRYQGRAVDVELHLSVERVGS
jgi:hypothetical protein